MIFLTLHGCRSTKTDGAKGPFIKDVLCSSCLIELSCLCKPFVKGTGKFHASPDFLDIYHWRKLLLIITKHNIYYARKTAHIICYFFDGRFHFAFCSL